MFNVIGAMAEFERAFIQERVKAGLRNARTKGKRLGRPKVAVDGRQVAALRNAGSSWSEVREQTGLTKGTAQRAYYAQKSAPNLPKAVAGLFLIACESPNSCESEVSFFDLGGNACPKSYELQPPTFFITITSFHDAYLMSGGFVGSRLPKPG